MHKRTMIGIALVTIAVTAPSRALLAQDARLKKIEERLSALEEQAEASGGSFDFIKTYGPIAFPLLGLGLFCGFWARNSGRDFWLWFTAGLVFNVLTLIFVLDKNEKDEKAKKATKEALDL